jgi:hypothetical protein
MRLAEVAVPSLVVASLALAATSLVGRDKSECMTTFVPPTLPTIVRVEVPVAPPPVVKRVESSELALVFSVGKQSFVKLGSADGVKHGKAKHVKVDGMDAAIAKVTGEHPWLGREVMVDGICKAKVTELAIVARLEGYDEAYTTKQNLEEGAPVLAGKLDGCAGKYARPAALPAVVIPASIDDDALAAKAKALVLASRPAEETAHEWLTDYGKDNWQAEAQWDIRVFEHPLTGQTWVSAHAYNEWGCGDPAVNIWGLFRVSGDGKLTATQLRDLGDMVRIDQLIDVEGDGEFEVLGRPWLGTEQLLTHESGEAIDDVPLAFVGCAC